MPVLLTETLKKIQLFIHERKKHAMPQLAFDSYRNAKYYTEYQNSSDYIKWQTIK